MIEVNIRGKTNSFETVAIQVENNGVAGGLPVFSTIKQITQREIQPLGIWVPNYGFK
ncbi:MULTISPECIES: hypothetical protein [Nitrosomonas]|uniref:hypothetical protein n=1 Tax=Nitrosomonas TaxID=914 RepID=UPI0023F116DF|nr:MULTISPECIES: hypothetical protein [Nitrosomonas]